MHQNNKLVRRGPAPGKVAVWDRGQQTFSVKGQVSIFMQAMPLTSATGVQKQPQMICKYLGLAVSQ